MRPLPNPWAVPTLAIEEAGQYLGQGRTSSYEKADSGELPTISVGSRRRRVPTAAIYQLLGLPLPDRPAGQAVDA